MDPIVVRQLLNSYKQLKDQINDLNEQKKEIKAQMDDIEEQLLARMKQEQKEIFEMDGMKIKYIEKTTPARFSKDLVFNVLTEYYSENIKSIDEIFDLITQRMESNSSHSEKVTIKV